MELAPVWDLPASVPHSLAIARTLARRHALNAGPYAATLCQLIDEENYEGLCRFELDYTDRAASAASIIEARQAVAFFQKADYFELGNLDRETAAWVKFQDTEDLCRQTNIFFKALREGTVFLKSPEEARVLYAAQRIIARVLGRCPTPAQVKFYFGPGATTTTQRKMACAQLKLANTPSCSSRMLHSGMIKNILREVPHWAAAHAHEYTVDDDGWLCEWVTLEVTPARLAFVPKTALTYRSMVVEPTLNGFAQLGYGTYIRKRLAMAGVDLTDQSYNAACAREGSIDGILATIDLSSASDTIARELVKFLLPRDWYTTLDSLRSDQVAYGDCVLTLEKFSSMGNGFTFPLQSLIFWALTRAAVDLTDDSGTVNAYGDDIVCPSIQAPFVAGVLATCGFVVNQAKSYWTGPFRESCGHDYYKGINVRPCYMKAQISPMELFRLYNFYHRQHDADGCEAVLAFIPKELRLFGPAAYGDGHLWKTDWDPPALSAKLRAKGYGGAKFDTFRLKGKVLPPRFAGDSVTPLYHVYTTGADREFDPLKDDPPAPLRFKTGKDGAAWPLWPLKDTCGYERTTIYTLCV